MLVKRMSTVGKLNLLNIELPKKKCLVRIKIRKRDMIMLVLNCSGGRICVRFKF